uniref:Uncharacterized protein n=1 Tax=Arundo donax TaxID=35708 RepID=A0A0A8Y729_ARUDO
MPDFSKLHCHHLVSKTK